MYTTLDLVNFLDNSDDNSDEESYENFNTMYCENIRVKRLLSASVGTR